MFRPAVVSQGFLHCFDGGELFHEQRAMIVAVALPASRFLENFEGRLKYFVNSKP